MLNRVWMAVSALLLGGLPASAYTIQVTSVDTTRGGNVNFRVDGANYTGYAGVILGRFDGGTETLSFLCIDLFTDISYGTYGAIPAAPDPGAEQRVAWLYVNQLSSVNSVALGQGFQLAIWDIIHDGGDGPDSGRIRRRPTTTGGTPTTVVTAWTNYLNVSVGMSSMLASVYQNFNLSNNLPAQNFIGPYQGTGGLVPEPDSWLTMATASGALLFGLFRRRSRQDPPPPAASS